MSSRGRQGNGLGLVLSGGGLDGAVQAGMLQELTEAGLRPNVVVGVSAGSCNAVYLAGGDDPFSPERARELCEIWRGLGAKSVFPQGAVGRAFNVMLGRDGLHRIDGLRELIEALAPTRRLEDLSVHTEVGAVDALTGEMSWFTTGEVVDVLCASSAIPGVFPPVAIDGRDYIDGGVVAPLPVLRALEVGASRIVAVDVTTPPPAARPRSALRMLVRAYTHSLEAIRDAHVQAAQAQVPVSVLRSSASGERDVDFGALVDRGRAEARLWLADNPLPVLRPRRWSLPWAPRLRLVGEAPAQA